LAAPRLKYRGLRIIASLVIVAGVVAFWVLRPIKDTDMSVGNMIPTRNDRLAELHAPIVQPGEKYGGPRRILYRMAANPDGNIYIAYHLIYDRGVNPHSGLRAVFSRNVYTSGLNLKNFVFGAADIELVEVVLAADGGAQELSYESGSESKKGSIRRRHETQRNPKAPYCFHVSTWDHLLANLPPEKCAGLAKLPVTYFASSDWEKFGMVKKTEAILRRNRPHKAYERRAVAP
jgi:hypothetical protein